MVIGILGDGQLARMLALSAYPLGIKTVCYGPNVDGPAGQVSKMICGTYDDEKALKTFFSQIDVATYESENIPWQQIEKINTQCSIHPAFEMLAIAQDRVQEKSLCNSLKIPTAKFSAIDSLASLKKNLASIGVPSVLKTRRFGYDGKGQFILRNVSEAETAWETLGKKPSILEQFIDYQREVSLVLVRSKHGEIKFYPLVDNHHQAGILRLSEVTQDESLLQKEAEKIAEKLLKNFNYIGVFCIEFFQVGQKLLVNEIAPRVHNSGHWTIEGAETSQFENHCRAITGLPLGSTHARGLSAMINCIGDEPPIEKILTIPYVNYHHYGKEERPNRKLGHITLNTTDPNEYSTHLQSLKALCNTSN